MKHVFCLLVAVFTSHFATAQQPVTPEAETHIKQAIVALGAYMTNPAANPIVAYLSATPEPHLAQKLEQMQQQLPKGTFAIGKMTQNSTGNYEVSLQLQPFNLPFAVVLDPEYKLVSINITDGSQQEEIVNDSFALPIDRVALPFELVDGYIMIQAEVNGTRGRLMLDTGCPFGLFLNNHYLKIEKKDFMAKGNAGSGQEITLYKSPTVTARIANSIEFTNLERVPNADFAFIEEGIAPDFMGFIGYEFLKDYEFVVDYGKKAVSLYKIADTGNAAMPYTVDGKHLATLVFNSNRDEKQLPAATLQAGIEGLTAVFDTGSPGSLSLKQPIKEMLLTSKTLITCKEDNNLYTLQNLQYYGVKLPPVECIALNGTSGQTLDAGYAFLKNYISVWNYKKRTITLFTPR